MKAKCSICGLEIRSRRSSKGSAQANLLRAMNKHQWKMHRNTMISRIKAGKASESDNPNLAEFFEAVTKGITEAVKWFGKATKKSRKKTIKQVRYIKPFLGDTEKMILELILALYDDEGKLIVYH